MNSQELKEFFKSIKDTDIEEIHYHSGEDSLHFKKINVAAIIPITNDTNKLAANKDKKEDDKKENDKKASLITIKSTMVGTFANIQSNDRVTSVKEGDNITVGQKIGQIEAMKIIKDINSNVKGKILKILVSNGQSVEYGQELFLVDTKADPTDKNRQFKTIQETKI
jgi:biotin carboxyl carrier protein